MREWDLDTWKDHVTDYLDERAEASRASATDTDRPSAGTADVMPVPPIEVVAETIAPIDGGPVHVAELPPLPIPAPPPGLPEPVRDAWIQARVRAGDLARGLGNYLDERTASLVGEVWDGAEIEVDADAESRARNLRFVREKTAQALAEGWTREKLASRLGELTGDWARNWDRIAQTEMQGALNEGVALAAVRTYGDEARVARVPNAGACPECRRVFLEPDGTPRIFGVAELAANGVNAGRPKAQWLPSLFPLHPNCLCGVQTIPPGYTIRADGRLARDDRPAT